MTITIESSVKKLADVECFIYNLKSKYNIKDEVFSNILVSITEAVNNAIIHGNSRDKNKKVVISHHIIMHNLHVFIEDEGSGFEPQNIPDPTLPENLEKTGGRGVLIMKNLCNEIHFQNNGSCVELIFNLK